MSEARKLGPYIYMAEKNNKVNRIKDELIINHLYHFNNSTTNFLFRGGFSFSLKLVLCEERPACNFLIVALFQSVCLFLRPVPIEFEKFDSTTMGLSSLPAPSEGVLNVLLVNTALSISMLKCIVRLILHIVGVRLSFPSSLIPSSDSLESSSEFGDSNFGSSWSHIETFRNRHPTIRFDKVQGSERCEHDCSVCLTQFKPESGINHLSCGHLFHTECLEKWLDYWNITCPLCRTPLMSKEEKSPFS